MATETEIEGNCRRDIPRFRVGSEIGRATGYRQKTERTNCKPRCEKAMVHRFFAVKIWQGNGERGTGNGELGIGNWELGIGNGKYRFLPS